jgi:hypothetical protein
MDRRFATLGVAVVVIAAAAGIHAQQQFVRGNGQLKLPALVRQLGGIA